jgi:hypothetical protein
MHLKLNSYTKVMQDAASMQGTQHRHPLTKVPETAVHREQP